MTVELSDIQCDILYTFMLNHNEDFKDHKVLLNIVMEQLRLNRNMSNAEIALFKDNLYKENKV